MTGWQFAGDDPGVLTGYAAAAQVASLTAALYLPSPTVGFSMAMGLQGLSLVASGAAVAAMQHWGGELVNQATKLGQYTHGLFQGAGQEGPFLQRITQIARQTPVAARQAHADLDAALPTPQQRSRTAQLGRFAMSLGVLGLVWAGFEMDDRSGALLDQVHGALPGLLFGDTASRPAGWSADQARAYGSLLMGNLVFGKALSTPLMTDVARDGLAFGAEALRQSRGMVSQLKTAGQQLGGASGKLLLEAMAVVSPPDLRAWRQRLDGASRMRPG